MKSVEELQAAIASLQLELEAAQSASKERERTKNENEQAMEGGQEQVQLSNWSKVGGNYFAKQPCIRGDLVIFVSEGDLFSVSLSSLPSSSSSPNASSTTMDALEIVKTSPSTPLVSSTPASYLSTRRLTTSGDCSHPRLSPFGGKVAFTSRLSGVPQVFVMDSCGSATRRVTWLANGARPIDWIDEASLLVASTGVVGCEVAEKTTIVRVDVNSESPAANCRVLAHGDWLASNDRVMALGRYTADAHVSSTWMHYNGGTKGQVWISQNNPGKTKVRRRWTRVLEHLNIASPILWEHWLVFVTDPDETKPGNLFRVNLDKLDHPPEQLTFHQDFYVRNPCFCHRSGRLVYQCGGLLYTLDLQQEQAGSVSSAPLLLSLNSFSQGLHKRVLDSPFDFLDSVHLHPEGLFLSTVVRGRVFESRLFEGPLISHGDLEGRKRYIACCYLRGGSMAAFALSTDPSVLLLEFFPPVSGDSVHNEYEDPDLAFEDEEWGSHQGSVDTVEDTHIRSETLSLSGVGRPMTVLASPTQDEIVVLNTRNELILIRYGSADRPRKLSHLILDQSDFQDGIEDPQISSCGTLVVYSKRLGHHTSAIFAAKLNAKVPCVFQLTEHQGFRDSSPCVDPQLRYVLFVSSRNPRCFQDDMYETVSFSTSKSLMLAVLRKDTQSPFLQPPSPPSKDSADDYEDEYDDSDEDDSDSEDGDEEDENSESDEYNESDNDERGRLHRGRSENTATSSEEEKGSSAHGSHRQSRQRSKVPKEQRLAAFRARQLDFAQCKHRVYELPMRVKVGYTYHSLACLDKDRVIFIRQKMSGTQNPLHPEYDSDDDWDKKQVGDLMCYYLLKRKQIVLRSGDVVSFQLSMDGSSILLTCMDEDEKTKLSAFSTDFDEEAECLGPPDKDEESEKEDVDPCHLSGNITSVRTNGPLHLEDRITLEVSPVFEWEQMLAEVFSTTMEHNHRPRDVPSLDIFEKYRAILPRIRSRASFDDLVAELLAEYGISHLYTADGDFEEAGRSETFNADIGRLGVDGVYSDDGFVVSNVVAGNAWSLVSSGPLAGIGPRRIKPGDKILSINNRRVSLACSMDEILVGVVNKEVLLRIELVNKKRKQTKQTKKKKKGRATARGGGRDEEDDGDGEEGRREEKVFRVRSISGWAESNARYFDAVRKKRAWVHQTSKHTCGYVHIPSMDTRGFTIFTQAFLLETEKDCLIVDLRGNIGGSLSEQLLEKLTKVRVASCQPKFGRSFAFPLTPQRKVLLVDETTCSDAEVFAYSFRALGLGPVVGTTTWGGVTGIYAYTVLVDHSYVTHPSVSFEGTFGGIPDHMENRGIVPDHPVHNVPVLLDEEDISQDTQLQLALELVM